MSVPFRTLRVEEAKPEPPAEPAKAPVIQDVDYWRRVAVQTGERLAVAEDQLKALRAAADDARARFGKYKERGDRSSARVNDLQIEVVRISADRDALREQLAKQDEVARKVHEYRQSLLNGPLWDLFVELAVCPPPAGEGK